MFVLKKSIKKALFQMQILKIVIHEVKYHDHDHCSYTCSSIFVILWFH